jgi:hypothetical protein
VAGLVSGQQEQLSAQEHNKAVATAQQSRFARYCDSISKWLKAELDTQAKDLSVPGSLEVTVETFPSADTLAAGFPKLHARFQFHRAFAVKVKLTSEGHAHGLFFFIATGQRALMMGWGGAARVQDADIPVSFLPYYAMGDGRHTHGFLGRAARPRNVPAVHQSFYDEACVFNQSKVEKWPTDQHEYKATLDEAFEVFFEFVKQTRTGSYGIGR